MKRLLFLAAALLGNTAAFAGTAGPSDPINVIALESGVILFDATNGRLGAPSCATMPTRFAIPSTTDAGRTIIALLLTAQARGKKVSVIGNDACNVWGDTETVSGLFIEN